MLLHLPEVEAVASRWRPPLVVKKFNEIHPPILSQVPLFHSCALNCLWVSHTIKNHEDCLKKSGGGRCKA